VGQPVIDAGGLLGQVIEVRPSTATVLLLTDPDHAVPVTIARNGIRLVAYGRGDRIELANIPTSSDVKVGDQVVTSGLGGRFPPGFPVGTLVHLRRDESRIFLVGDLRPAAQLDRGRDVLLLRRAPAPPATTPAMTASAAATTPIGSPAAGTAKPAADATAPAAKPTTGTTATPPSGTPAPRNVRAIPPAPPPAAAPAASTPEPAR
jgi:rod shape-determining protein MreC